MKDIGGKGRHRFAREAWTFMPQHHLPEKVFVIERLRKIKFEGRLVKCRSSFASNDRPARARHPNAIVVDAGIQLAASIRARG